MEPLFKSPNPTISYIEQEFQLKYRIDLDGIKKNWNVRIRDFLRDSVGLKMTFRDAAAQQVEISFVPDKNNAFSFSQLLNQEYPDIDLFKLAKLKDFAEAATRAQDWYGDKSQLKSEFEKVKLFANNKLKEFDIEKILKDIIDKLMKNGRNDIFGAYFINDRKIQIYYVPCIAFARIHKLDVQSFCIMVLAHELAHAYHHVGFDPDGKQWLNFIETDDRLAESLAQFYTRLFVEKHASFNTSIRDAFYKLLEYQSEPYTIFKTWKYSGREVSVSAVNATLNECRRNNIKDYSRFESLLDEYAKRLK